MSTSWRRGLYVITDPNLLSGDRLPEAVGEAIAGGAVLVQFRDKRPASAERGALAEAVLQVCRAAGVPLLVNDDVALAARIGADGVHLGRDDLTPAEARDRLGPQAIIGLSCYNEYARAEQGARAAVDYLAFGRFFASHTKPHAVRATPGLLSRARRELDLPLVAIGGITPENGRALVEAGADLLAVVHGVFGQPDVRSAARDYAGLFDRPTHD